MELWTYLDAAKAMFRGWGQDSIDSQSMTITPGRVRRAQFQQGITEEARRYAADLTVFFSYAR